MNLTYIHASASSPSLQHWKFAKDNWQSTYVSNNESLLCHHDNDSLTTLIKLSPPTVINSWIELQFQRTHENWITLGASTILYRNESKFLVPSKRGQSLLSLHVRGNCTFEHRVSAFYVYIYIYICRRTVENFHGLLFIQPSGTSRGPFTVNYPRGMGRKGPGIPPTAAEYSITKDSLTCLIFRPKSRIAALP